MTQNQRDIDNEIRHHELLKEMGDLKRIIENVNYQMQELREGVGLPPNQIKELWMPKPYEHPWDQYQRKQSSIGGDCGGSESE